MKLQIKTLNQKCLVVDIEETKTVYELKKELSLYPDVGVKPEMQKLIYAGQILENEEKISTYNINVNKFLVIMIIKQPLLEPPKTTKQPQRETVKEPAGTFKGKSRTSTPTKEIEIKTPTAPLDEKKERLVTQIVLMGYTEPEVRKALAASFYNPERAIEYLIDGVPTTPSTPERESYSDTEAESPLTPFEVFRGDPTFQSLRSALQQNPQLLDAAIQRTGETNPALLNLISEHQHDFLSMLVEGSDDEDDSVDEGDN